MRPGSGRRGIRVALSSYNREGDLCRAGRTPPRGSARVVKGWRDGLMSEVLLINMPFAHLRWPTLGPSLLKAALGQRGIRCEVAYLNYDFAERIGLEQYNWIADQWAFVLGGERLFARHYFGGRLPDDEAFFQDVLRRAEPELTAEERRQYEWVASRVGPFLDEVCASRDWSRYALVGFTATFQQTMASLCLARRIKRLHPEVRIALGGAACDGPMGVELARQFPLLDYVFLGEADWSFPLLVERLLGGEPVGPLPGVVDRPAGHAADGEICSTGQPPLVWNLDALPYPDFDEYFHRRRSSPLAPEIDALLFFESSRGCWWGEKHHCLFCGLNGSRLAYRSKTSERVVEELRYLLRRYRCRRVCSADNVFDYRYFATLLPRLQAAGLDLSFVYELKPNLTRRQVQMLLDAGLAAAQLGIETFSSTILERLRKGTRAIHNLQALKWFTAAGIEVQWNLLYGFPGEDPAEYEALTALLPSLFHLAPPVAIGQVRLDRFSPYFQDPARHGIVRPRADRAFRYVFPFPQEVLDRIAYHFEYEYADGRNPLEYASPMIRTATQWQSLGGTVTLRQFDRPDGLLILSDTRPSATAFQHRLVGLERLIYLFCDAGRPLRRVVEYSRACQAGRTANEPKLKELLDRWVHERLMACLDGRYISLALEADQHKRRSEDSPAGRCEVAMELEDGQQDD